MTRRLHGVAAAPGTALAAPWVYRPPEAGHTAEDAIGLADAATRAAAELGQLADGLRAAGRADEAGILDAQQLMATDPDLLEAAARHAAAGASGGSAIERAAADVAATLEELDDPLLAARAADVRDVGARIARIVRGEAPPRLDGRAVVLARDLPPSVTVELDRSLLAGIALEGGSRTAHAAILARALEIPAVVGIDGLLAAVDGAGRIGLDGDAGEVILDPDPAQVEALHAAAEMAGRRRADDAALRDMPLATRDGRRLVLAANIGTPDEAKPARAAGAEAVGLFRTEFAFMGRAAAPGEASQVAGYASVLRTFAPHPVVIRLLDVGGDKELPYLGLAPEANPFLGVRAIRLAERDPALLATQLRAILAAGAETGSEPWIMAPMVADLADVRLVRGLLDDALAGFTARPPHKLGVMIEIPSAATLAQRICGEVDFVSIGTNDLTQYVLAADRTNPALAARQDPFHPAVLRAVVDTVAGATAHGVPVAVCGEMAGDPAGAVCLAGLGVGELSMEPASFASVKRALASVTLEEARQAAEGALAADTAAAGRRIVDELLAARREVRA